MDSSTTSAAAVLPVPALPYGVPLGLRPSVGPSSRAAPRFPAVLVPTATAAVAHFRGVPRRLFSALGDIAGIMAIIYAFPVAILAIGMPIALLVWLVMRIAVAL